MNLRNQIEEYQDLLTRCGTEGGGITRLLYTKEWLEALEVLKKEMDKIGMQSRFDEVGNLFGVLEGESDEYISTGSHIDTVVEGGNLDGQFGIVAGLIAIKNLAQKYGKPKKSLQLIALAEEEGSRFPTVFWGSNNVFGIQQDEEVKNISDKSGNKFVDEMRARGFDFRKSREAAKIGKFVEIHIEQGNLLEQLNKKIGVITAITGQMRYNITVKGQANHAGTTRMCYRKDASWVFAKIVDRAINKAKEMDELLVVTFGKCQFTPNTVNVVPGKVEFTVDTRHPNKQILETFAAWLENEMQVVAKELDCSIEIDRWMSADPVDMDSDMIKLIEDSTKEMGFDYEVMHSGAGHDSQIFAKFVPTGMIFVPSIGGISHNIREKTDIEDLEIGVQLLENILYKLAY